MTLQLLPTKPRHSSGSMSDDNASVLLLPQPDYFSRVASPTHTQLPHFSLSLFFLFLLTLFLLLRPTLPKAYLKRDIEKLPFGWLGAVVWFFRVKSTPW